MPEYYILFFANQHLCLGQRVGVYSELFGNVTFTDFKSVFEDEQDGTAYRVFNRSNGYTQIAGGTITTEQIQDPTRSLIIDFQHNPPRIIAKDRAEIVGNIVFKATDGQSYKIDQYVDDQYGYLKRALKGTTEIVGGLVLANTILLKDSAGQVYSGWTGLAEDCGDIVFWSGGDFASAKAGTAKYILYKDGSASYGGGKIKIDPTGNEITILGDTFKKTVQTGPHGQTGIVEFSNKIIITSKKIETNYLPTLYTDPIPITVIGEDGILSSVNSDNFFYLKNDGTRQTLYLKGLEKVDTIEQIGDYGKVCASGPGDFIDAFYEMIVGICGLMISFSSCGGSCTTGAYGMGTFNGTCSPGKPTEKGETEIKKIITDMLSNFNFLVTKN